MRIHLNLNGLPCEKQNIYVHQAQFRLGIIPYRSNGCAAVSYRPDLDALRFEHSCSQVAAASSRTGHGCRKFVGKTIWCGQNRGVYLSVAVLVIVIAAANYFCRSAASFLQALHGSCGAWMNGSLKEKPAPKNGLFSLRPVPMHGLPGRRVVSVHVLMRWTKCTTRCMEFGQS